MAADMKGQLTDAVKAKRSERLLELTAADSKEYRRRHLYKAMEVLFEERKIMDGKQVMTGHTREYIQVALETEKNLSNEVMVSRATDFLREDVLNFLGE